MRLPFLVFSALLASLGVLAPQSAGAADAPSWIETSEPTITPGPTPTPPPIPAATPTPAGPRFTGFNHRPGGDPENGFYVTLYIEGTSTRPATFRWSTPTGTLSAPTGTHTTWYPPRGRRSKPLSVPLTVAISDGLRTLQGHITVVAQPSGEVTVTQVHLPGLPPRP